MSATLEELLEKAREIMRRRESPGLTREEKINWVLGNLNASTNHRTTREVVEKAFDDLEAKKS